MGSRDEIQYYHVTQPSEGPQRFPPYTISSFETYRVTYTLPPRAKYNIIFYTVTMELWYVIYTPRVQHVPSRLINILLYYMCAIGAIKLQRKIVIQHTHGGDWYQCLYITYYIMIIIWLRGVDNFKTTKDFFLSSRFLHAKKPRRL